MLDLVHFFPDQMQIRATEQVVRFRDRARDRIFDRQKGHISFAALHCVNRRGKGSVSVKLNFARGRGEMTSRRGMTVRS